MKILYIAPFATDGYLRARGEENNCSLACSRKVRLIVGILAKLGHDVMILSSIITSKSRLGIEAAYVEEILFDECKATVWYPCRLRIRPFGGLINCLNANRIVEKLYRRFEADLLIVYNSYVFEARCAAHLKKIYSIPFLLEAEDLPSARQRGVFNIKANLDRLYWNRTLALADGFTAVNSRIFGLLPKEKPRLLLPGIIDAELIRISRGRKVPFAEDRFLLGYFGDLGVEKGAGILIEIARSLPPRWRLVVTGAGQLGSALSMVAQAYPDKIMFLGKVDQRDLYDTLCRCDCTLIPWERSGVERQGVFPFKAFEYIVSGSHMILPRLASIDDVECGYFQRWLKPTSKELLTLLAKAKDDFAMETDVRENTIQGILRNYSEDAVKRKIAALLSEIVESV